MDDMVAFSVAREDTLSGSSNPVTFAVSLYNAGYHYDELRHNFIAPSSRVNFFSFSLDLIAGANFILYKNNETVSYSMAYCSSSNLLDLQCLR